MNNKGLELLDRKDLILGQALSQLEKGEINQAQFDVSPIRHVLLASPSCRSIFDRKGMLTGSQVSVPGTRADKARA